MRPWCSPWPAAIVVFASAEIARHAQRLRVGVDDDHRVDAIFVTCRQWSSTDWPARYWRWRHRLIELRLRWHSHHELTRSVRPPSPTSRTSSSIASRCSATWASPPSSRTWRRRPRLWLRHAIPSHIYRGWMAATAERRGRRRQRLDRDSVAAGPMTMDPRCGFVFNVYTQPAHRKQGLARR